MKLAGSRVYRVDEARYVSDADVTEEEVEYQIITIADKRLRDQ